MNQWTLLSQVQTSSKAISRPAFGVMIERSGLIWNNAGNICNKLKHPNISKHKAVPYEVGRYPRRSQEPACLWIDTAPPSMPGFCVPSSGVLDHRLALRLLQFRLLGCRQTMQATCCRAEWQPQCERIKQNLSRQHNPAFKQ